VLPAATFLAAALLSLANQLIDHVTFVVHVLSPLQTLDALADLDLLRLRMLRTLGML
jgi:hypothetical protein